MGNWHACHRFSAAAAARGHAINELKLTDDGMNHSCLFEGRDVHSAAKHELPLFMKQTSYMCDGDTCDYVTSNIYWFFFNQLICLITFSSPCDLEFPSNSPSHPFSMADRHCVMRLSIYLSIITNFVCLRTIRHALSLVAQSGSRDLRNNHRTRDSFPWDRRTSNSCCAIKEEDLAS